MHKIECSGKVLFVEDGVLLSDALRRAEEPLAHPCGGRGTCKKCTVIVNGEEVLACQYHVYSDICVALPDSKDIHSESGAEESGQMTTNVCFALDIGTTTLALALVSLDDQRITKTITRNNPQQIFGADVMSRILHCQKHGVTDLFEAVRSAVNQMIAEFALPEVPVLYVSGNTTMLHLFFNVDCSSMGTAPYTPTFLDYRVTTAAELGIDGVQQVHALPSISAFVGADLVAGWHFVDKPKPGKYHLLVDLGTNAEILLFSDTEVLCTAAAAGPCFEGANISCGMSATDGAIYAYSAEGYKTIGNEKPKGICGTGLVDVVAALLEDGVIDETGYLEDDNFEIAPGINLSQSDVRQFQVAKSAVHAAIITLLQLRDVSAERVDKLYIAGGFSAKINLDSAVRTGLIPASLRDKCVPVRNSSLLGTVKYAYEPKGLSPLIRTGEYIDLSANPYFSDLFVENMMFDDE